MLWSLLDHHNVTATHRITQPHAIHANSRKPQTHSIHHARLLKKATPKNKNKKQRRQQQTPVPEKIREFQFSGALSCSQTTGDARRE